MKERPGSMLFFIILIDAIVMTRRHPGEVFIF